MSSLVFEPPGRPADVERRRARACPVAPRPAPTGAEGGQVRLVRVPGTASDQARPRPQAETFLDESDRFLRRAVRLMVDAGVRQFLKIDRGLAPGRDTRRALQEVGAARVVVVDSNPMTLALARTLRDADLVRGARFDYVRADLTDPESLLSAPQLRLLDLSEPVGLLLGSVLHLVPDHEDPHGAVARLVRELAAGSYLAVSHFTGDHPSPALASALQIYRRCGLPTQLRARTEVERFFAGLELVEPGVELASRWRRGPDDASPPPPDRVACLAGVGRVRRQPLAPGGSTTTPATGTSSHRR
jgi:hypothetical protein